MSLLHAYASDDDNDDDTVAQDAFGIANVPAAKKIRTLSPRPVSTNPAPHVLQQVCTTPSLPPVLILYRRTSSPTPLSSHVQQTHR